jgi:hypothetical protein
MKLSAQIEKIAKANGNKSTNDYDLEYLKDLTATIEESWVFMLNKFGYLEKANVAYRITQDLNKVGVIGMQYRYAITDVIFYRLGQIGVLTANGITLRS